MATSRQALQQVVTIAALVTVAQLGAGGAIADAAAAAPAKPRAGSTVRATDTQSITAATHAAPADASATPAPGQGAPTAKPRTGPAAAPTTATHRVPDSQGGHPKASASPKLQAAKSVPDEPYVFTNDDLKRFARPEDAVAPADAAATSAGQNEFEKQARENEAKEPAVAAFWQKQQTEAAASVQSATERLNALRRQQLADGNPLAPQPKLTQEEQTARQGKTREQLVKGDQDMVRQAESALQAAKEHQDLVDKQASSVKK
jgi:hypothetical protein